MGREHNPGDHRIAKVIGPPLFAGAGHEISRVMRGGGIEPADFFENLFECLNLAPVDLAPANRAKVPPISDAAFRAYLAMF